MFGYLQRQLVVFSCIAVCSAASLAGERIGAAGEPALFGDTGPSFSWMGKPGAIEYELAIFEDTGGDFSRYQDLATQSYPILSTTIPATELSWTAGETGVLADGGAYVW